MAASGKIDLISFESLSDLNGNDENEIGLMKESNKSGNNNMKRLVHRKEKMQTIINMGENEYNQSFPSFGENFNEQIKSNKTNILICGLPISFEMFSLRSYY
jgi:hypothetical protein